MHYAMIKPSVYKSWFQLKHPFHVPSWSQQGPGKSDKFLLCIERLQWATSDHLFKGTWVQRGFLWMSNFFLQKIECTFKVSPPKCWMQTSIPFIEAVKSPQHSPVKCLCLITQTYLTWIHSISNGKIGKHGVARNHIFIYKT